MLLGSRRSLPPVASTAGLLCALGVAACGPKSAKVADPAAAAAPEVIADTPVLPAPEAPVYSVGRTEAADPLVQKLVEQGALRWAESLSGAAGALALRSEPAGLMDARWAAVRAGYPHSVLSIIQGEEAPGAWPAELLARLGGLPPGTELGIARARGPGVDRWVVLVARPDLLLNSFPRELDPGETLRVTGAGGAWALMAPDFTVQTGALPLELPLDQVGEWWLQVRRGDRQSTISVPLFVGVQTPVDPLFGDGPTVVGHDDLVDRAWSLVDAARDEYGLPLLAPDPGLAALAAHPLAAVVDGSWTLEAGVERLRKAGYVGGPAHQLTCTAPQPAACVAGWLDDIAARAVLLDARYKLAGIEGQARADGVTLLLNLSAE